jgi:hypothetical protein
MFLERREASGEFVVLRIDGSPLLSIFDDLWVAAGECNRGFQRSKHEFALLGWGADSSVRQIVPRRALPEDLSSFSRTFIQECVGMVWEESWCTAHELADVDWERPEPYLLSVWYDDDNELLDAGALAEVQASVDLGSRPEDLRGRTLRWGSFEHAYYELGRPEENVRTTVPLRLSIPNVYEQAQEALRLAGSDLNETRLLWWFDQT